MHFEFERLRGGEGGVLPYKQVPPYWSKSIKGSLKACTFCFPSPPSLAFTLPLIVNGSNELNGSALDGFGTPPRLCTGLELMLGCGSTGKAAKEADWARWGASKNDLQCKNQKIFGLYWILNLE